MIVGTRTVLLPQRVSWLAVVCEPEPKEFFGGGVVTSLLALPGQSVQRGAVAAGGCVLR